MRFNKSDLTYSFLVILLFMGSCQSIEPPRQVKISTPVSISQAISYPAFWVEIRKDKSIWYNIVTNNSDTVATKTEEPLDRNLSKIIAEYNESRKDQKKSYLVKARADVPANEFNLVVEALKENGVYKFNLVGADSASPGDGPTTDSLKKEPEKSINKNSRRSRFRRGNV